MSISLNTSVDGEVSRFMTMSRFVSCLLCWFLLVDCMLEFLFKELIEVRIFFPIFYPAPQLLGDFNLKHDMDLTVKEQRDRWK